MMIISSKGAYGIAALFELAQNAKNDFMQIKDIAEKQGIPQNYLEQLLVILKKAGFVESLRGAEGGYRLAKHPSRIKVSDILNCLEGPPKLVNIYGRSEVLKNYWQSLPSKIEQIFSKTLEELVLDEQKINQQLTYFI